MTIFEGLLLGVIQGITEFLPISSSGHLILVRDVFGISSTYGLAEDAVLQLATALAVVFFFRAEFLDLAKAGYRLLTKKDVSHEYKVLIQILIIGTIPAVLFGLLLENAMETIFRNSILVAGSLILGSFLMVLAEKMYRAQSSLRSKMALPLGLFQALALIPGISRSGATISGGMIIGLSREMATKVSFMLSVPILLGSGAKKGFELLGDGGAIVGLPLIVAFLASFLVGLGAIRFLLNYLKTKTLYPFVVYRVVLAIIIGITLSI